jgi:hypothetical protein
MPVVKAVANGKITNKHNNMKRNIQDWQIRGGFTMNNWRLEVKEKNAWRVEAESHSTVELLKIAHGLTE